MAEGLGHHYTSHGDILDLSCTENRKQEYRTRYPEGLKKGAYILYFIPNLRVICLME